MLYDNWYESMTEAIETIEAIPWRADRQSLATDNDKWAGGSFDAAMRMAKDGWRVERDLIDADVEDALAGIQDRLNAHLDASFNETYDVAGGYVDVDRYLMGEPECMVEQWVEEAPKRGKVLKVVNMVTASHAVDEKVLRERGRGVAAAVDVLFRLGFSVELWCGEAVSRGPNMSVEMVKIKEAPDPLDWDAVMFGIGHPTMLRRFTFALNESRPADQRKKFGFQSTGGYGSPDSLPESIADGFDVVLEAQRGNRFDKNEFIQTMLVTADSVRIADVEV
jgi:hypothetical protein